MCDYLETINQHEGVYDVLKAVSQDADQVSRMTPEEQRVLKSLVLEMQQKGVGLSVEDRQHIHSLSNQSRELQMRYALNS